MAERLCGGPVQVPAVFDGSSCVQECGSAWGRSPPGRVLSPRGGCVFPGFC